MLVDRKPHHVHIFERFGGSEMIGLTRIYCYQRDCYADSGPSLSRELYPPEKIGPKLMIAREE